MNSKKNNGRVFNELLKIRQSINQIKKQTDAPTGSGTIPHMDELVLMNKKLIDEVTERQKAVMELKLSQELFFKIFHCSPLLICITTLKDFRYIDVNEAFLKTVGFNRENLVNQTVNDLNIITGKDFVRFKKLVKQGANRDLEFNIGTRSGDVRPSVISTEYIDFNNEKCLLWIIRDLTEIRSLEKEMARLGQLNLVGEMAASIGHEIRNPMTTARGFLQMLGGKPECVNYKEYFDLIIEELDRANTIVSEFLSVAQIQQNVFKKQNLNKIVNALLPLIQADAIIRDISAHSELGNVPDLPLVEKEIRQLILNLARNALDSMPNGGTITVKTYMENEETVLSIADQGSGVKPEYMDKLGTPFFTTKENGTGLGLPVCYSIASKHNAMLNFDTGPNGTTFFVRFKNS